MNSCESELQPGGTPGSVMVTIGAGRLQVDLELRPVGVDWLLLITGGAAHVGAVGMQHASGRPVSAVLGSHREGPLATDCAGIIARASGTACAAVAGIHQDQATGDEIKTIVAHAVQGTRRLAVWLKAGEDQRYAKDRDP